PRGHRGSLRRRFGVAAAGHQTPGSVNTYPERIPVSAGDVIGIFFGGGGNFLLGEGLPGDNIDYDMAELAPGSSGTFTQLNGYKLPVEPDADHDGYGDETQDQCPRGCVRRRPHRRPQPRRAVSACCGGQALAERERLLLPPFERGRQWDGHRHRLPS